MVASRQPTWKAEPGRVAHQHLDRHTRLRRPDDGGFAAPVATRAHLSEGSMNGSHPAVGMQEHGYRQLLPRLA